MALLSQDGGPALYEASSGPKWCAPWFPLSFCHTVASLHPSLGAWIPPYRGYLRVPFTLEDNKWQTVGQREGHE